jgi:heme A synthase
VPLAAVKAGDILEVIWVSLVAAVIVSTAFSLVVLGSARSAEARRSGHARAGVLYGVLATVAMLGFLALVAFGLHVMLSKD